MILQAIYSLCNLGKSPDFSPVRLNSYILKLVVTIEYTLKGCDKESIARYVSEEYQGILSTNKFYINTNFCCFIFLGK